MGKSSTGESDPAGESETFAFSHSLIFPPVLLSSKNNLFSFFFFFWFLLPTYFLAVILNEYINRCLALSLQHHLSICFVEVKENAVRAVMSLQLKKCHVSPFYNKSYNITFWSQQSAINMKQATVWL